MRMIFMKILNNKIQLKKIKYWSYLMIRLLIWLVLILSTIYLILNPIVTELFIRGRKWNISLFFITQSYIAISKHIRLNSTHYFIIKVPDKQELQQIGFNNSSVSDYENFMNIYKKYCKTIFFFSDWLYSYIK